LFKLSYSKNIVLFFTVLISTELFSIDTLFIADRKTDPNIIKNIYILEDPRSQTTIDQIIKTPQNYSFSKNNDSKLNFEFSTSTYWLKVIIKNNSEISIDYILSISNPDLNYIDLYELVQDTLFREIHTGEFRDISTREVYHRNFIFNIDLKAGDVYTYLISVNNGGGPLFIPVSLKERTRFEKTDNYTELFYWMMYGLLVFIFIFNLYLYWSTKDVVSLYYSLSILFATLFFLYYDGYFFFFNLPVIVSKFKFLYPSLYTVFLISFTQAFAGSNPNFRGFKKYLNPLKILAIIAAISNIFPFPVSLVAEIGVPLLIFTTLILIIFIAIATLDTKYYPSIMLLIAFLVIFLGLFIHELKEFDILPPVFFINNSTEFGLTIGCIILTIAVLERFRISQDKAKSIIHENYLKIEGQNKELEIVNIELEKLSIVASETNNSVAIYDKNGRLEWCNSGFEKFYEFSLEELIVNKIDHIETIIPNKDIKKFFVNCMDDKKPFSFETKVVTKKKKEKWVQTTITPYPRLGKITKVIAIDSDITDLKNYERELEITKERAVESDRLKTVFLGNMSHEIRTPLNGILGFTELLGRTSATEDKKERYYKLIMSNGEQLLRIIDDIVDLSLIESNQLKIEESKFDLNILINDVIDYFELYKLNVNKPDLHIILQNELRYSPLILYTDPVRLKQVLMNLLKNSFKFTNEGYIRLECIAVNQAIRFTVEDTGIGIDPAKSEIIFDRFRQGDESLSRKYGGTGLGLSISKGIIEKMRGSIWIDPEYQTGLRICIEIPQTIINTTETTIEDDITTDEYKKIFSQRNFLVVEDDDTSYELLTEILSPFEITLTQAVNGEEAVELVMKGTYDLVLMDINLPVLDGIKATREIRKFNSELIIIAQTAYALKIEKDNILASGCNDIVCKPINSLELFQKIAFHLYYKI
jgi:PAS domain S-box-containing protein